MLCKLGNLIEVRSFLKVNIRPESEKGHLISTSLKLCVCFSVQSGASFIIQGVVKKGFSMDMYMHAVILNKNKLSRVMST